MKAAIFEQYGPPDVLRIREANKPIPRDNEVLIKVHASTVTSGDCPRRSGEPLTLRFFSGLIKPKTLASLIFIAWANYWNILDFRF